MNLLKEVVVENFRNEDGDFPSNLRCSNCNCSSEVFIEIVKGGPILRLCKGCLTNYIERIDKTYRTEMSLK
jgi:hypothetical protein